MSLTPFLFDSMAFCDACCSVFDQKCLWIISESLCPQSFYRRSTNSHRSTCAALLGKFVPVTNRKNQLEFKPLTGEGSRVRITLSCARVTRWLGGWLSLARPFEDADWSHYIDLDMRVSSMIDRPGEGPNAVLVVIR